MAFCVLLGAISHSATPLADHSLAAADNAFGFKLIKRLAEDHPATNISISSYSAATVLHMVGSGAAGKTKTEMQQVLATTGLSLTDVNAANREIAQSLTSANTPVILTVANAIWYRPHTPINPSFISTNKQFYGATVEALNFSDPHAVEIINAWASEKTQGKIKRMADGMIDPESTRLFLADAIYFKGKWSKPFAVKDTKDRSFHLHAGGEKRIPMKAAFDGSGANFSGIAPGLFISAAQQKTLVEVNEEGTEAAVVTGMEVQIASVSPRLEPFDMIVDRPFLFLIEDKQTEVILFMGTVFDPTANRS
jgi:serine protease inhibitor